MQRSVPSGHLEHLLNDADGADALNVVRTGIFGVAIFEHGQADRFAFAQRLFHQLDAGLLDDGQRNNGVREQHGFLQRQDADGAAGDDRGFLGGHLRNESSLP